MVNIPAAILARADVHDYGADHAQQQTGRKAHHRSRGQSSQHIFEQTLHSVCENLLFAIFGVITLDHANAAERLREPARDLGIDLAALAKDRADRPKGFIERNRKEQQESEGDAGHHGADAEQHHQRDTGGQQTADQIDQSSADQVANAFDIAHDARDQHAALGRIVKRNWQPADMRLHFLAKFRDQALRSL